MLVLVAGAVWLVRVWATAENGAAEADPQASVLAVLLAAAVAAVGVLAWAVRRRRQASLPATAEQVDQASATLAGLVREQWQEEARARALGDPEPMPVRWRLTSPSLMDHPTVITRGGSAELRREFGPDRPVDRRVSRAAPSPPGDHRCAG